MSVQRREYFRVEYPENDRPRLDTLQVEHTVIDVSEYGIKFQAQNSDYFEIGTSLTANITFNDGEQVSCMGKVIRLESLRVVVLLEVPIPLRKIRSEHINLINKYYNREEPVIH